MTVNQPLNLREKVGLQNEKTEEARSEAADSLAIQNLEQDVPRTNWDRMCQLHEEVASSSSS
jgi:hypothetical protein